MKLRIQDIKKETFKLLGNCLGFNIESSLGKIDNKKKHTPVQTPDFYNSRINGTHRKSPSTSQFPG